MYYTGVYYAGNDYRNYVSHSLGEWLKPTKYKDKIVGAGGKVRYIYDTATKNIGGAVNRARTAASNFVSKNVTGSAYKKQMRSSAKAMRQAGDRRDNERYERAQHTYRQAQKGYSKSLRGRAESAGRALRKVTSSALKSASGHVGRAINRGRDAVRRFAGRAKSLADAAGRNVRGAVNKFNNSKTKYAIDSKISVLRERGGAAINKGRQMINGVLDYISKNITGSYYKKGKKVALDTMHKAGDRRDNEWYERASSDYKEMVKGYNNSAFGKVENGLKSLRRKKKR